jgi:hypothetical protein
VNRLLLGLAVLGLCVPFASSFADKSTEADDFTQPQSPARPTPKWVQIIDQGPNDPPLKGYKTPEGLQVEIVADYPVVVNPVGMTFGDDGTLYVLEWRPDKEENVREYVETFTYKDGSKRQVATMKKRVKDVVKVLRDTKGKGVYDEAKVLLEEELPSSLLVHDGWLYLSGRGTVRRYKLDEIQNPKPEMIAQGFGGFRQHQVSGLTLGNDGWLCSVAGRTGRGCTSMRSASAIRTATWPSTLRAISSTQTTTARTAASSRVAG